MITKESLIEATEDYEYFGFVDINQGNIVGIITVDPEEIDESIVIGTFNLDNSVLKFLNEEFDMDEYLFYRGGNEVYKVSDCEDDSCLKALTEKQLTDFILRIIIDTMDERIDFYSAISGDLEVLWGQLNTELKESNLK